MYTVSLIYIYDFKLFLLNDENIRMEFFDYQNIYLHNFQNVI